MANAPALKTWIERDYPAGFGDPDHVILRWAVAPTPDPSSGESRTAADLLVELALVCQQEGVETVSMIDAIYALVGIPGPPAPRLAANTFRATFERAAGGEVDINAPAFNAALVALDGTGGFTAAIRNRWQSRARPQRPRFRLEPTVLPYYPRLDELHIAQARIA